jgi:3-hydroxy-3-methylglutaryl CoA synthase
LKTKWIEEQEKLLMEGMVRTVVKNVRDLQSTKKEATKLIEYFEANQERMKYNEYRKIGCGIFGSGAIESAHRKVIQKRMKQSGQRWSKAGAQNMLNLRVTKCNGSWERIVALTKTEFRKAA